MTFEHQIHCFRCRRDPGQNRYYRYGRFEVGILNDEVPRQKRKAQNDDYAKAGDKQRQTVSGRVPLRIASMNIQRTINKTVGEAS